MQPSNSPIASLNTHQHALAAWCCEQIAEFWGRLSRPQASLGQLLFQFRKRSREWPWQGAVGGRCARQNLAPLYTGNERAWAWVKRVEGSQLRTPFLSTNHKLPRLFQT